MKVLVVHEAFAPEFRGGGEVVMLETARQLMLRGVSVQVLTTGDPAIREYEGIATRRLPYSRYRFNCAAREVARSARDADVIITATYHGCLPALLGGERIDKPVVCIVLALFREIWKDMRGPFLGRFFEQWERYLVTRSYDRWLFISDYSREIGTSMRIPADKTVVSYPGIALESYGSAAVKDDVVFVTGKLDYRKGILEILEAARDLPEVRFRIMGWGDKEAQIRAQAPTNIEFIPFERGARLREMFGRALIFLFPSKGETFGIALVEAMASGCAVISSVPLPFEGIRIDPADPAGLRAAIRKLWQDRAGCRQMGQRNHQLAQQYSWARYTDGLMACLDDVCSERSTGLQISPRTRNRRRNGTVVG